MDSCNRKGEAASMRAPLIDFGEDDTSICLPENNSSWSEALADALPFNGLHKQNQEKTIEMPIYSSELYFDIPAILDNAPSINPFANSSALMGVDQSGKVLELSSHVNHPNISHGPETHVSTEPPDLLTGSSTLDSSFFHTPSSSFSAQAPDFEDWSSFLDSSSTHNPFDSPFETKFVTSQYKNSTSTDDYNDFVEEEEDLFQIKSSTVRVRPELNDTHLNHRPKSIRNYSDAQPDFKDFAPTIDDNSCSTGKFSSSGKKSAEIYSSMAAQASTTPSHTGDELHMNLGQTTHRSMSKGNYTPERASESEDNLRNSKSSSSPNHAESEKQDCTSVHEELFDSAENKSTGLASSSGHSVKMEKRSFTEDFVGAGGGKGIFKTPYKGAVDPSRPVSLELRPPPLGDEQADGTNVLFCTDTAVWAGCETGLKVWNIDCATDEDSDGKGNLPGDKDAAAFILLLVHGASTLCLASDVTNRFIWSGHKDGKVRAWLTDISSNNEDSSAVLMWQAHRTPVLALVVTAYGELWTGSENGALKAWSLEEIIVEWHLSSPARSESITLVSPEYIDLKARGIAAGASNLVNTDVHILLSEHSSGRVWSGGSTSLALWNARTRDVLKVFGPNSHPEFLSPDLASSWDVPGEADVNVNYAKVSKKEKTSGSLNFFQRSRIAVMGAADAVRRAAGGCQAGDDSKKLEALAVSADGTVWGGYANGMLMQWDGQGKRLQDMQFISVSVKCICTVGHRVWAGYTDGRVQVITMHSGKLLGTWIAHSSGVVQIVRGGNYVFTLASHGGIRGWQIASPCPIDLILKSELSLRADSYTERQQLHVLAATWNVSEEKASQRSLQIWLSEPARKASIVFVGLQEMEMGAGAIAMAAAKETVGFKLQEKGTANYQWWLENIAYVIGEGQEFERVGSRQLAGIFISVWVRRQLLPYLGEVDTSAVACGFGRALGNKGAVGVRMVLYRRIFCFVSSHFAAHMDAVGRRNADFDHVYKRMSFGRSLGAVGVAATAVAAGVSTAVQILRGSNLRRTTSGPEAQDFYREKDSSIGFMDSDPGGEDMLPELSEADLLVWVGDLNYRIDELSYEEAVNLISQERWKTLLANDQLRTEMALGRVFQGMREGAINFPPSYKFDKGYQYLQGYDSSEKKRVPAWCDRVLFRDSFYGNDNLKGSDLSHLIMASVIGYDSCMEVVDSDHKPVWCMLNVDLAPVDEAARRRQMGDLMHKNVQIKNCLEHLNNVPEIIVNTDKIFLADGCHPVLKVSNESKYQLATFVVYCEGNSNSKKESQKMLAQRFQGGYGFPRWLQVDPAAGIIHPNQSLEIRVLQMMEDHKEVTNQPLWDVLEKDETIRLAISVRGEYSRLCQQFPVTIYRCPASKDHHSVSELNVYLQRSAEGIGSRWNSQDASTFSA